jgi:chromosome segregation ATPase
MLEFKLQGKESDHVELTAALQKARLDSERKSSKVERLESERKGLEEAVKGVQQQMSIMCVENATLLSSLDKNCMESFLLHRSLEEKMNQMSSTFDQLEALQSLLERNEKRATQLEEALRGSRFDSKNKTREIERLAKELASNKAVLQESKKSIVLLKQEVSSSKSHIVKLSDTKHQLEESGVQMVEQISNLLSNNEDLSNLVQIKTDIILALESKLKEANDLNVVLEENLNTVKVDKQSLNENIEFASIQIDMIKEEMQDLADKLSDANKQISQMSSNNAMLKSSLDEKIKANDDLEKYNEDKHQQVKELMNEITTKIAELERKEKEFVAVKQDMAELDHILNKRIDGLNEKLAAAETEKQDLLMKSEEMKERISTIISENATLQTIVGKKDLANKELEQLVRKKEHNISTLTETRRLLESEMIVNKGQVIQLERALEEAQSDKMGLEFLIKEANSTSRKFELEYAASVEKLELFELVISQKDQVASELLEALNEVMLSSDDRDEELAVLTDENNELSAKLDEANIKISRMHSKMQGLRTERNNAMARVHGLISGNSSRLETKVKEVSTRIDSDFAALQQRVDILDADILILQSKNKSLETENAKLRDDKKEAEERILSLEETKAKKVSFSSTCAPPGAFLGAASRYGVKTCSLSPVSSYTSGSGFFDPEVAEQVTKALELAKKKLNKGSE